MRHVPSPDLFSLHGRTAIVTGSTRGIGRAIATGFAEAGATVVVSSRSPDACREVVEELSANGHRAVGCPAHTGSAQDVERLVTTTIDQVGSIDIVVNNAATSLSEPVGEISPAALNKAVEVNLLGPILLIQAATPHLAASRHASVINVVSAGAWMFLPQISVYSATKAALVSFTRTAAASLAPDGIRVNALAPGVVDTDKRASAGAGLYEDLVRANVMGRAATPAEMVGPAVFLASDASSFMTGSVLHIDGGTVAA